VRRHDGGAWSIAIVNRNRGPVKFSIALPQAGAMRMRKYAYDPAAVRHHPFGDLPGPSGALQVRDGRLGDTVGPMSLTVYTSAFDESAPAAVRGVRKTAGPDGARISWTHSAEKDLCYYRVYRIVNGKRVQIGSTIATHLVDREPSPNARYAVTAVDQSGNEGPG
jgi:hypothetical protein